MKKTTPYFDKVDIMIWLIGLFFMVMVLAHYIGKVIDDVKVLNVEINILKQNNNKNKCYELY